LIPLVAIFVGVLILFYVLYTTAVIEGDSMVPSLEASDYILVERGYETPLRGDIVVYDSTDRDGNTIRVVKRVVAVPGDTVRVESGQAYVNGVVEECQDCILVEGDTSIAEYTIPDESLFVLGDNRPYSLDSRHYGPVPFEQIVGQAVLIFAPTERVGRIDESP
jgi:signal peptidase I